RLAVHHRQRHFLLLGMGWSLRGGVLGGLAHSRCGPLRAVWLVELQVSAPADAAARTGARVPEGCAAGISHWLAKRLAIGRHGQAMPDVGRRLLVGSSGLAEGPRLCVLLRRERRSAAELAP